MKKIAIEKRMIIAITMLIAASICTAANAYAAEIDRNRTIVATTVIGATTGAILGQQHGRSAESAIVGGVLGAMTGAILTANRTQVAYNRPYYRTNHRAYRPVIVHRTVVVKQRYPGNRHEAHEHHREHREYAWSRGYGKERRQSERSHRYD